MFTTLPFCSFETTVMERNGENHFITSSCPEGQSESRNTPLCQDGAEFSCFHTNLTSHSALKEANQSDTKTRKTQFTLGDVSVTQEANKTD